MLGMAVARYIHITARPAETWKVTTIGAGSDVLPTDSRNLIATIMMDTCSDQHWQAQPLEITVKNDIPIERGLGSSSTAVVAGIMLAFLAHGPREIDRQKVFSIATEFEGHPDNVGPAIFGGLLECGGSTGNWFAHSRPIHPDLRLVVAIPRVTANTKAMRGLLPASYTPEQEAVTQRAITTLLKGLEVGDPKGLIASEWDVKHHPYRFPALPESYKLYQLFQSEPAIAGAFLSGAGPTVAGWVMEKDTAVVEALASRVDGELQVLPPDIDGVQGLRRQDA